MKKRKPAVSTKKPPKKAAVTTSEKQEIELSVDEITQSSAFRRAAMDADAYARDPQRLRQLIEDAVGKINVIPRGPFGHLAIPDGDDRLIRAYHRAEYRDRRKPRILAAIIYFVSPFDVIPDYVDLGHIDDAVVISLALRSVRSIWTRCGVGNGRSREK